MPAKNGKQDNIRPIIVKKVIEAPHAAHHGGAWKVAYADFVTAMMAFFLLMWLIGATTEKQRKSIADYFAPTLMKTPSESAGGYGPFGGESILSDTKMQAGAAPAVMSKAMLEFDLPEPAKDANRRAFRSVRDAVEKEIRQDSALRKLAANIRFTETREGLRIDMVDDADFSMFFTGTSKMTPDAMQLLRSVNGAIRGVKNPLIIRGHTDSAPWTAASGGNNWKLSTSRAEQTRQFLTDAGIDTKRIARIEGVADSEPYVPDAPYDARNRRISITLGWANTR